MTQGCAMDQPVVLAHVVSRHINVIHSQYPKMIDHEMHVLEGCLCSC